MNNDNERNVNGQPGVAPPADAPQSHPGSVSGASEAVSPQTQNAAPDVPVASQFTEPIPNQSIPNQPIPNQPIPNQSIPNQPSMTNQKPMPEQPQQNAAPQGGSAPQPQYQPGPQQAAPSQGMNGQQQYQYQSQTGAGNGQYRQNNAPYQNGPNQPAGNYSRTKGFAIASLVCGICSIVLCCLGFLALLAGIAAIVFGILVLSDTGKNGSLYPDCSTLRGMAIGGLACGAVGTVIGLSVLVGVPSVLNFVHDGPFDDFDSFGYMDF